MKLEIIMIVLGFFCL